VARNDWKLPGFWLGIHPHGRGQSRGEFCDYVYITMACEGRAFPLKAVRPPDNGKPGCAPAGKFKVVADLFVRGIALALLPIGKLADRVRCVSAC
jgi:hypothetical protein